MKITFIASESNPFIKTGGLADVVYSLAQEFVTLNHEVNIIIPFYSKIKDNISVSLHYLGAFQIDMSWRKVEVKVCKTVYRNITYYFIENDRYFARRNVYGESDEGERFAFFSQAAINVVMKYDLKPDILHVHDWQVGMIPCLMKEKYSEYFKDTKSIITIHNPAFQGTFPRDFILDIYSLPASVYDEGAIRLNDNVSTLKAGIMYADKITTVSPTHRLELLTPEGGMGLEGAFRLREFDFVGILRFLHSVSIQLLPLLPTEIMHLRQENSALSVITVNPSSVFFTSVTGVSK